MDPEARRRAGIADGLVRVSIGLEDVDDLIEDFDRALEKV
jgi:cystathionine beta-lyase/cystathionine gamma-synthase